jgi:protein-tyrosine phosphatase
MNEALPELDGVTNFRELGGLPTREGRRVRSRALFRSGHWGRASDGDIEHLERLGVGVVLDFRTERDIELEGADRLTHGIEHVALPTGDSSSAVDIRSLILEGDIETLRKHFGDGGAEQRMTRGAAALATDQTENFAGFLHRLAKPGCPPALFHCSAGKDRAGWAASCVLLALGVEEKQVIDHYLISNQTYDPGKQRDLWVQTDPEIVALVTPLAKVRSEYVQASIDAARDRWGSLDGYFREGLGLEDALLAQLRNNWLEDS